MNKEETIVNVVALVTGAAVGFGVGYYIQKRKYEKWFAEDVAKQQNIQRKEGVFSTPQGAVRELIGENEIVLEERPMDRDEVNAALIAAGYAPLEDGQTFDAEEIFNETGVEVEADEIEEEAATSITGQEIVDSIWANSAAQENFVSPTENEDQDNMPEPSHDRPFVITVDQFMLENDHDDNKISLVYYEGDDQMTDEREQLVGDIDRLVGSDNLHRFGLGSRDRNALYVRNLATGQDFEIIRDKRTYQEVVLGIKPTKRSDAPRRMREDDE